MAVITFDNIRALFVQPSPPSNQNAMWRDTSVVPNVSKLYNSVSAQWEEIGAGTDYDGNRAIKALPFVGQIPGGNTIQEFLDNIYYPAIAATITLNSFALQEVGVSFSPNVVGTITPNDSTINARRVEESNITVATPLTNSVNEIFGPFTMIEGVNKSYAIEADITTSAQNSTVSSPTRNVNAVYPFFQGVSSNAALSGTVLYGALTKLIQSQGNKTVNFTSSNEYLYFCYPASYPDLSSIKDPNNFEVIGSFNQTIANVTSTGLFANYTESYKIYRSNNLVTLSNSNFQFIF